MAFLEIRFPESISYGISGGPTFDTAIVYRPTGYEDRDERLEMELNEYEAIHGVKTPEQMAQLRAFFRIVRGRSRGFRYKDWMDFVVLSTEGILNLTGIGDGTPVYQCYKKYTYSTETYFRIIQKLVAGTFVFYKNAVPLTVGGAPGNIGVNINTGLITFVATDDDPITGHTPGASHQFTTANNIAGLAIGKKVYITGVTGTAASLLNSLAHTISNKTGAGPFTWTISTNTAGLTAANGTAFEYPQATDALTFASEFDVPCRFDTDKMRAQASNYNVQSWNQIPIVETRDIT